MSTKYTKHYYSIKGEKVILIAYKHENDITLRLDKYKQYWVPFNKERIHYLDYEKNIPVKVMKTLNRLLELGEFIYSKEVMGDVNILLSNLKEINRTNEW